MGAETPTEQGKRSSKRARVLLGAKLKTARGDLDARLRDLSRKGALLECKEGVALGEEVVFVRGGTVVPARVAWIGGNRVGVEFLKPIQESEVLIHVGRPAAPPQPQVPYRRPGFIEGLTDFDRELARKVGASLGVSLIDD